MKSITRQVGFRLDEDSFEVVVRASRKANLTLSSFIRQAVLNAAKG